MDPTPDGQLERRLQRLRVRVRWLLTGYGVGRVVTTAVAAIAAVVLLDFLLDLPGVPRLAAVLGAVAGVAGVAWLYLVRPMAKGVGLSDVAGRAEEAFPEFEDRLRSAILFSRGNPSDLESDVMRRRVYSEATAIVQRLDLRKAVDARPARKMLAIGGSAALLLSVATLLAPTDYRRIAIARLVTPFAHTPWPRWTEIATVGDLPDRVAAGERLPVAIKLAKGDRTSARATVFYQYDDGPVRTELMTRGPDGTYAASLDTRTEADQPARMKVWVQSGDDEKHLQTVTVVPRLVVRKVTAEITPPDYARSSSPGGSGGGGGSYDLTQGPVGAVEGSQVRLRLEFNKPLAGPPEVVEVKAPTATDTPPAFRPANATADGPRGEVTFTPDRTLRFTLRCTDADGFATTSLAEYEIAVRPDQSPAIQIDLPRRSEERTATAAVPLQATAEDDFAVRKVTLHVRRLGDGRDWTLPLVAGGTVVPTAGAASFEEANSAPDRVRMRLRYLWELTSLGKADLKPGDVLEYFLSARDNYRREVRPDAPGGEVQVLEHAPATSSRLRITIVSPEDLAARATEELRTAGEQIAQLKLAQQRTATDTQELADAARGKDPMDEASREQARRLAEQQGALAAQAKGLSGRLSDLMARLAENRLDSRELAATAQDVRDVLDRAAEGPMKQASSKLDSTRTRSQPQRDEAFAESRDRQTEADKLLGQAVERLSSLGSVRQTMDSLRKLLADQQDVARQTRDLGRANLGKTPEEMSPADRARLAELADRQKQLSAQTQKLTQQMQKQAEQMKQSDPQSSQALEQASGSAQQQQVSAAQSRAAAAVQQNQQSAAQTDQRRAEVGLQVMLDQLREAERRKLEELTRKLADLQEQLRVLVRRQAGHNLDNLGLRGGELARLADPDRAGLLALAERTPEKPSGGDLPALSAGQEQTERNARALSENTGTVEGAADVAGVLSRAASRMERAAVLVRQKDLGAAYEPPQVEALALLTDAARRVAEMQKKAQDQQQERDRETIRGLYQAARDEQDALLRETRRLDTLRKRAGDNGELPRVEQQKLLALPAQQKALADKTAKIEESLTQLGSVVYVWANKDIVSTMNDAGAALGDRRTDRPVQSDQQQAVEQLEAMIASLTIKPPEKEFEQGGGGGGGSGGGGQNQQRLPSEAELRLLKQLQVAVNNNTRNQSANPDKTALDPLGRRQGELRRLTGELLEKASQGQFKLGPEPDRRRKLPEELAADNQDKALDDELLGTGKPDNTHGQDTDANAVNIVDRMGRVRQRLADDADPGGVTQKIQTRILKDIDDLIEEARQQQQQSSSSSSKSKNPSPGQSQPAPQPGAQQAGNQGQSGSSSAGAVTQGGNGARNETDPGGAHRDPAKAGGDIRERASEWGALAPRQRQAVLEGQQDAVLEKYRSLVDDYYRSLAEKSGGKR